MIEKLNGLQFAWIILILFRKLELESLPNSSTMENQLKPPNNHLLLTSTQTFGEKNWSEELPGSWFLSEGDLREEIDKTLHVIKLPSVTTPTPSHWPFIGWNLLLYNPTLAKTGVWRLETSLIDILVVFKLSVGTNYGGVFNVGGSGCLNQPAAGRCWDYLTGSHSLIESHLLWASITMTRLNTVNRSQIRQVYCTPLHSNNSYGPNKDTKLQYKENYLLKSLRTKGEN